MHVSFIIVEIIKIENTIDAHITQLSFSSMNKLSLNEPFSLLIIALYIPKPNLHAWRNAQTHPTGDINLHDCVQLIVPSSNVCVLYEHLLDNGIHHPFMDNGIHHNSQMYYK